MPKTIPSVTKYMTTTPHSVAMEQAVSVAYDLMKKYHIRHLPVLHGGELRGLLSDRDVKMAMGFKGFDPEKVLVSEIALEDPYLITPQTKLDEVVETLAEKRIGSALVIDNHKLVGIFTTTDALRAFGELLHSRLGH